MTQCRHAHHNDYEADAVINFASFAEGVAGFLSDLYWLGGLIDLIFLQSDQEELTWWGLGFGSALALITAAGATYSHRMLNRANKSEPTTHLHEHDSHAQDESTTLNSTQVQHYHNINHGDSSEEEHNETDDHHAHNINAENTNHTDAPSLTWIQKIALAGDWASHTGEIAGPLVFVGTNIIEKSAGLPKLPLWGKATLQCAATLFGGVGSIANVRSCRNSILKLNANQAHEQSHHHKNTL